MALKTQCATTVPLTIISIINANTLVKTALSDKGDAVLLGLGDEMLKVTVKNATADFKRWAAFPNRTNDADKFLIHCNQFQGVAQLTQATIQSGNVLLTFALLSKDCSKRR